MLQKNLFAELKNSCRVITLRTIAGKKPLISVVLVTTLYSHHIFSGWDGSRMEDAIVAQVTWSPLCGTESVDVAGP
jgi:hypothetical protein